MEIKWLTTLFRNLAYTTLSLYVIFKSRNTIMFKQILKSKTMLFNIFVAIMAVVELNMNVLQPLLGDHYGVVFMVIAVVNAILRIVTTTSLKDK